MEILIEDFRNAHDVVDSPVMFGGGWNAFKVDGKTVKPNPIFYELKSTSDPWTFNVNEVTRMPSSSMNSLKAKFYN